jgi:RNA polymerase sigma-70 factor (ECF subfamily)
MSQSAWLAACERSYPQVYRALLGLGARPDEAADAVQDAFEHALVQRAVVANPAGWLFVVAKRRWQRRRLRERIFFPLSSSTASDGNLPSLNRIALVEELRRLPSRQREIVVCRYLLELTQAETAAALGIATGTVAAATAQATRRLKQRLEAAK